MKPTKKKRVRERASIHTSEHKVGTSMQLSLVGRAANDERPYIAIFTSDDHTWIEDRDVRRLRDWCNEILEQKEAKR